MTTDVLLREQHGGVLVLTLNRPDTLNALTPQLLTDLRNALEAAGSDDSVRCVVLTGAGRGFCSGADLSSTRAHTDSSTTAPLGGSVREYYTPLVLAIRRLEKPVIASLNGVAAGAGASIALTCDLRIVSDQASLVEAFVHVGLIPDSGGTVFLPLLVGLAKASELAFTGRRIMADEALQLGLVNRIVPGDELRAATLAWAQELAALPTRAIGLTKRGFNRALLPELEAVLDHEADLIAEASATHDHKEGVAAFREKRKPDFRGN